MIRTDLDFAQAAAFDRSPDAGLPYIPSPTAEDFIEACRKGPVEEMRLLILMGSRGEGKTTCGLFACLTMAETLRHEGKANLLPIRVAVVRDTWVNLSRTTIASFQENERRGLEVTWKDDHHEAIIEYDGVALCHFFFFGLDNRDDADKLQGFQCGILWLEEVAPAAELANGIPPEALGIGGTSLRQAGIPKRILVTLNPPDEEHWIMSVEKTLDDLGLDEINVKRFVIPAGEKSAHFRYMASQCRTAADAEAWALAAREFDAYRNTNEALLNAINRGDLVARLVKGEVGGVTIGEAIVPEFGHQRHTTTEWIAPVPGVPITRCWDAGLTPSTVWYQITPSGNVNIFGSRLSINRAMGQHILEQVIPFQQKYGILPPIPGSYDRKARKGFVFRDIADPALRKGNEQTKAEETAAFTLENMLKTSLEFGPVAWPARRSALKTAFYRPGQGDRALVRIFRPECKSLVQSLNGKAHYPTDARTGRILETVEAAKKASGIYFQELDALAYGFAVQMPAEDWLRQVQHSISPRGPRRRARTWMGT